MEEKFKNKKNELLKKINLPREVLTGEPKITIIGEEEITIENHKGIRKFDEKVIVLNSSLGKITIEGSKFEILYIEEETIVVQGKFEAIYYGDKRDE